MAISATTPGTPAAVTAATATTFSRSPRFSVETTRLACATDAPETLARRRLLHAMAAMGALPDTSLSELDYHRILDTAVLITRTAA
jgi:hypothetical protein